jgi:hypothetical protein
MPLRQRCDYEGELFESDDFEWTAAHGLVHYRNMRPGAPVHTTSGHELTEDEWRSAAIDNTEGAATGSQGRSRWSSPSEEPEQ